MTIIPSLEYIVSRRAAALLIVGMAAISAISPAAAGEYRLLATNIMIDDPSPLFTNGNVSGILTLADSVAPGAGFGLGDISFVLTFGGITVTSAETMQPGGDITGFGTRSADGMSISFLDIRYDLPSTVASCSFICAGQLEIATFDNSNFVAIDDPDAVTTSLLQFDAAFSAIPEPSSLPLLGLSLCLAVAGGWRGRAMRRRAVSPF